MKNILLKIILLISCTIVQTASKAQCSISKEFLGNNVVSYDGSNISIYENSENGLQEAFLSWIVWKKGDNVNSLKFFLHISVYTSGLTSAIAPNVVQLTFSDGRVLRYDTDDISSNVRSGIKMYEGLFPLGVNDFKIFQTANVISIKIVDNKTNRVIISHPHSDEIIKQLNCLIEATN